MAVKGSSDCEVKVSTHSVNWRTITCRLNEQCRKCSHITAIMHEQSQPSSNLRVSTPTCRWIIRGRVKIWVVSNDHVLIYGVGIFMSVLLQFEPVRLKCVRCDCQCVSELFLVFLVLLLFVPSFTSPPPPFCLQMVECNPSTFTQVLCKYTFKLLVLYLNLFFWCHFLLLLHYIYLTALRT